MNDFTVHVFDKEKDNVEKYLEAILMLEKECFPPGWQYRNAKEEYRKNLESKDDINLFLEEPINGVVGYLLAVPVSKVFSELSEYDPDLEHTQSEYYLETIGVLPSHQKQGGADLLIKKLLEISKQRNIERCSVHARKINGFNDKIKKNLNCYIIKQRHINNWFFGGGEPYEYICWHN